jgi:hypothetical protein
MEDKLLIAIAGGFVGGVLGVIGTIVSSYIGPRKFEEWKQKRNAEKWDNPRKKLLLNLLNGEKHQMRSIETLCRSSGTSPEECRRLLIEIEARGVRLTGNREGWVLIKNKPLESITENEEFDTET